MNSIRCYVPTNVEASIGGFELKFDPQDNSKYVASFEGKEIEPHRKLEIILEHGKPPIVRVEFIGPKWKHEPERSATKGSA